MPAIKNPFKSALARGDMQYGCWSGFADPFAIEVLGTAGFDWIVIDGEHAANDVRSIMAQLQALQGSASHPVVRVPVGEDWVIKQALDVGAQTVLVPMVESAQQAAQLTRAMRYPPEGIRGVGASMARASRFGAITDYVQTANQEICLLVQVESQKGVDALEDILNIDGIDGVFIGPADLAADLGHPGNAAHEDVRSVIKHCLERIAASDKAAGILSPVDEVAAEYRDWGAQFLAVGLDVNMFAQAARAKAAKWKS
ncbi:HpcH/HpaI aldolase family protein [Thalassobius sp. S69A]|uniref:HpcH/HpaI aldolase family protein n=1 Tax=unclassified Thalassovita TaxID=2619711 RepID=UPI000C110773|nr:2-keto-3-deoxy-L-rhamnonate aldolase [Paracoccaceae bacterium]MBT25571.1 2-keto-3-deoxy-L-rhamnonate aldolase [Paracoccaceae bacterium]